MHCSERSPADDAGTFKLKSPSDIRTQYDQAVRDKGEEEGG
jgi:hypothetical protein